MGNALVIQGKFFTAVTAVVVGGTALSGGTGGVLNSLVVVKLAGRLSSGLPGMEQRRVLP